MACECGQPKKIPGKNSAYIGKFYFLVRWSYAVEWHDFERSHFFISPCPCPLKGDTEPRQKRLHKLGGAEDRGEGARWPSPNLGSMKTSAFLFRNTQYSQGPPQLLLTKMYVVIKNTIMNKIDLYVAIFKVVSSK